MTGPIVIRELKELWILAFTSAAALWLGFDALSAPGFWIGVFGSFLVAFGSWCLWHVLRVVMQGRYDPVWRP